MRRRFVSDICHEKRICFRYLTSPWEEDLCQIFQDRTGSKYFMRGHVFNHNEEEDLFQIFQERNCWRTWCYGRQLPTVVSPTAYSAYTHFGSGAPPMPPVLPVSTQASPIPPTLPQVHLTPTAANFWQRRAHFTTNLKKKNIFTVRAHLLSNRSDTQIGWNHMLFGLRFWYFEDLFQYLNSF